MIAEIIVIIFLLIGCFFFVVGTTGLLRLPDVFSRLHPATKCDTLGAGSILLAMAIYTGWSYDVPRLAIIGFFLLISSATSGHAIGRSAIRSGLKHFQKESPVENSGEVDRNA